MQVYDLNQQLKCSLFREKVIFLHGHVITGHGISTDPDKIDTVRKWSALLLQEKCNSSWDSLDILPSLYIQDFFMTATPQRSNGPANVMPRCIPGVEGVADIGTSAHLPYKPP